MTNSRDEVSTFFQCLGCILFDSIASNAINHIIQWTLVVTSLIIGTITSQTTTFSSCHMTGTQLLFAKVGIFFRTHRHHMSTLVRQEHDNETSNTPTGTDDSYQYLFSCRCSIFGKDNLDRCMSHQCGHSKCCRLGTSPICGNLGDIVGRDYEILCPSAVTNTNRRKTSHDHVARFEIFTRSSSSIISNPPYKINSRNDGIGRCWRNVEQGSSSNGSIQVFE
mmetsp:Transcript_10444/g.18963  ORF Transcript_10444/g.18963 Transcript_10444/m.18963 type:complete len:222 (-) Transcript_10444:232-897(-)